MVLPVAAVAGSHTVVAAATATFEAVTSVHDVFAGDAEVAQSVIFFLHPSIGHGRNARALLR